MSYDKNDRGWPGYGIQPKRLYPGAVNLRTTDNCNNCIHGELSPQCKIVKHGFGGGVNGSEWGKVATRYICDKHKRGTT